MRLAPRAVLASLLFLALLGPGKADATEFRLDGYYRFQATLFDSLSLDRENESTDGVRNYVDNRLRLVPHLRINSNIHVFVDLDVFDALQFGQNPEVLAAAGALQESGDPFDEPTALSASTLPGNDYRESLFVRRAWVELYTPYVDIKVGRMGSHWGMGLLANDGNCAECNHGDTVDRILISTSRLDPVRINFAVDTRAEGFINRNDDTHSFLLSGGYLGEVHKVGAYVRWTRQPLNRFNLVHGDLWGGTKLGPLTLELEALIQWGMATDTEIGVEDLQILAGGGAFRANLDISPWHAGLEVGMATGDKDPNDAAWHTLTFDRDHDIALMMFEESLPTFAVGEFADEENQNIDTSQAVTGNGVSNAIYLRPQFHVDIRDNLQAGVSIVTAWALVPAAFGEDEPKFYGAEFDLEAMWTLYSNFEIKGTAGFFIPGAIYDPYRDFAFGGELQAIVRF